jgi:NAD(P)-dependent dehydrogenase (short-subunit alcohol dehydrogenase family)
MSERVVVITGATGGLGKQAAKAFADGGHRLALLSRDEGELASLAEELGLPEGRVLTQALDMGNAGAVRAASKEVKASLGGAHILLHLVGGWTGGKTLAEASPDDLNLMLDQHVCTTFNLFQAFAPQLVENGWGRAIMVSSTVASRPVAKRGIYAAAKAAQEALFLTLAQEIKEAGGTANIIAVNSISLDGAGTGTRPEEIVAAMLYLCSEQAAKVNGVRLPIV